MRAARCPLFQCSASTCYRRVEWLAGRCREPGPSRGPDGAEPQGESQQRRPIAPDPDMGEWQSDESDTPDTTSRPPRMVDRIKQAKYRPLTPDQRQQVVELFRASVPVKEIVRQAGVNRSMIYRLREQAGLERNHRFTDDKRAQASSSASRASPSLRSPSGLVQTHDYHVLSGGRSRRMTAAAMGVVPSVSKTAQCRLGCRQLSSPAVRAAAPFRDPSHMRGRAVPVGRTAHYG